jgi:hypothetical protein
MPRSQNPTASFTGYQTDAQGLEAIPLHSNSNESSSNPFPNSLTADYAVGQSSSVPNQQIVSNAFAASIPYYAPSVDKVADTSVSVTNRKSRRFIFAAAAMLVLGIIGFFLLRTTAETPKILDISASKALVQAGDKVSLTARMENADTSGFTYQWAASLGRINGNNTAAVLDITDADLSTGSSEVKVTLLVRDADGHQTSHEHVIAVANFNANPLMVELRTDQSSASVGESVPLIAEVRNQNINQISYEWQATDGVIEGAGAAVRLNTSGVQVTGNSRQISVTVIVKDINGISRSDTKSINVFSSAPSNWAPTVSLRADKMMVQQGENVEVIASARDKDGDRLAYSWTNSAGQPLGSGNRILLKTSSINPGQVEIAATVSDGRGETATDRLTVTVMPRPKPNSFPQITRVYASNSRVRVGERISLTVEASDMDNDNLVYSWETSSGSIQGQGANVTLDTSGIDTSSGSKRVLITVNVSDRRGGDVRQQMSVSVLEAARSESSGSETSRTPSMSESGVRTPGRLSASVGAEGENTLVMISGNPGTPAAAAGEVRVTVFNGSASVTGYFPNVPCAYDYGDKQNIKKISIARSPGPANSYSKLQIRFEWKDTGKPASFTIIWRRVQ